MSIRQLRRFLLTGIANSVVGWAVIFGGLWIGMSGLAANAAGYAVGIVVSFMLHRHYVFGVKEAVTSREVATFLIVVGIAYTSNATVLMIAQSMLGPANPLAQLPAIAT
jgi:putative flippase GtrA